MVEVSNKLLKLKHSLFGYTAPKVLNSLIAIDTTSDFTYSATFTASEEGGYSGDMQDGGNWSSGKAYSGTFIGSKYGVSAPIAIKYFGTGFTKTDMQNLTIQQFEAVFKKEFWLKAYASQLPYGVDLSVTDHGYNRGLYKSILLLQNIVGSKSDGLAGPNTIKDVSNYIAIEGTENLIKALYKAQCDDYISLNKPRYESGWLNRCLHRYTSAQFLMKRNVNV